MLRKYCNSFLSDFKVKDIWVERDRQLLEELIDRVAEGTLIERVKHIIIHQISIIELSKYLDLKAEDLNRGLLEASQEIREVKQSNVQIVLNLPQITLLLLDEFWQVLLYVKVRSIELRVDDESPEGETVKTVRLCIGSV